MTKGRVLIYSWNMVFKLTNLFFTDFMYSATPPQGLNEESPDLEPAKDMVTDMAQRFYDHFSAMHLDQDQWLQCLLDFLAESECENSVEGCSLDTREKIRKIVMDDKQIPLSFLAEDAKKAVFREVAEWLAAEKICEKMINYEADISAGMEKGRYRRFSSIEAVNVVKDYEETFGSTVAIEEMIAFIKDNYVVDMGGPIVGAGTRVEVRELKPVKFPLPYPKKDELVEGLRIEIPNRYLVVRLSKGSYKDRLGDLMTESENRAIKAFVLASQMMFFEREELGGDNDSLGEGRSEIDSFEEEDGDSVFGKVFRRRYSFIPPLLIIRARIGDLGVMEYMTIQKKIIKEGEVLCNDKKMKADFIRIPGFKEKVKLFIEACKRFNKETGLLPDLVGSGNVLYTRKGNVYMVDINNITEQPDLRLIALIGLYKDLEWRVSSPRLEDEVRDRMKEESDNVKREIIERINGNDKYAAFCDEKVLERILDKFYGDKKDVVRMDFLRAVGMIDNLSHPIHFLNMNNLHGLELDILASERESGEISDEEYARRRDEIVGDSFYHAYSDSYGEWKEKKKTYDFQYVLDNKNNGFDNWVSQYANQVANSLDSGALSL